MSLFHIAEFGDHWAVVMTQDGQLAKGVISILRSRDSAERVVQRLEELSRSPGVEFRVSVCHPGAKQLPGVLIVVPDENEGKVALYWLVGLDTEDPAKIDPDLDYAPVLPVAALQTMPGFESTKPYPQSLADLQERLL